LAGFADERWHVEDAALNLFEDFPLGISIKWHLSGKQLVQTDTQAPYVALFAVVARQYLWRDVVWSSGDVHLRALLLVLDGEAKINEFDSVVVAVHYVFGLDVPVDNVLVVAVMKCLEELAHQLGYIALPHGLSLFSNLLEQLSAGAQLHHKVDVLLVVVGLIVLDNILMINLLHDLYLSSEIGQLFLVHG